MTTQPDRTPLDDLTSDQLDNLYDRAEGAEAARDRLLRSRDRQAERAKTAAACVTELEAEVARLTAGQCTHHVGMCTQHHTAPVDGCPYPRCVKAREQQEAGHA